MTEITTLIFSYGGTVIMAGLFVWHYLKQEKSNDLREEKLYKVIETLANKIPSIEETLKRIENNQLDNRGRG